MQESPHDVSFALHLFQFFSSIFHYMGVSFLVLVALGILFYLYQVFKKEGVLDKLREQPPTAPLAYKSPTGKGYWVKLASERGATQYSFVSFTELYPEGTDMEELNQLKL